MDRKMGMRLKFLWAFGMMFLGLMLDHFNLGTDGFLGYGSVGTYLIYIGILGLIVVGLGDLLKRDRMKDERMEFVAAKAMRVTFVAFVMVAFAVMILDGIRPIEIPYRVFMSGLVAGMLAVLFISYKILLRAY